MSNLQSRIDQYLEYKESYYLGEPLISDEEFDEFELELINDGYDPIVGTIAEISEERKALHREKMLSLGKKKVFGDTMPMELAIELYNKYSDGEYSFKYDGLAIEGQYTDGILGNIVTRGNGIVGTNQTEKLKHLFPQKLNTLITIDIRCELVMPQIIFDIKYSKKATIQTKFTKYSHARNLAAGICNDENINDERKYDLEIAVLEGISSGKVINPSHLHPIFEKKYKDHRRCFSAEDIKNHFDECHKNRSSFKFGTDGLVYSSLNADFKHNGKHPDYAISVKFAPPRLVSTITNIKWKLHKTGRYVPKVFFEPIIVDGRQIKQASGHNMESIVKKGFSIGTRIDVVLSNDIIPMLKPYIEE